MRNILLNKLNSIKPFILQDKIFNPNDTRYVNYELLLRELTNVVNNSVESVNEIKNIVEWLVNEGLELVVVDQLEIWLRDGTLAKLINKTIFNELNNKLDSVVNKSIEVDKQVIYNRNSPISSFGFRIPFITVTNNNTIIAGCDFRYNSMVDESKIDIGICRSIDGGKTFSDYKVVMSNSGLSDISRAMDGTILHNKDTNRIYLMGNYFESSQPWYQSTTQKDPNWDCKICYSDDNGVTWSEPLSIRDMCPSDTSMFIGGVGTGVYHNGFMIFPIQLSKVIKNGANIVSSYIYSNDGINWIMGKELPCWSSENSVYFDNNKLKINARVDGIMGRAIYSSNGIGMDFTPDEAMSNTIVSGGCMGNTISIPNRNIVLFTNPVEKNRSKTSVYVLNSNGTGFIKSINITDYSTLGYSCLAYNHNKDELYILYEDNNNNISFKNITNYLNSIPVIKGTNKIDRFNYLDSVTIYVDPINGVDNFFLGTQKNPYKTLDFAIKDLSRYKDMSIITIFLVNDTNESLTIKNNSTRIKIEGIGTIKKIKGLYIVNSNVTIENIDLYDNFQTLQTPLAVEFGSFLEVINSNINISNVSNSIGGVYSNLSNVNIKNSTLFNPSDKLLFKCGNSGVITLKNSKATQIPFNLFKSDGTNCCLTINSVSTDDIGLKSADNVLNPEDRCNSIISTNLAYEVLNYLTGFSQDKDKLVGVIQNSYVNLKGQVNVTSTFNTTRPIFELPKIIRPSIPVYSSCFVDSKHCVLIINTNGMVLINPMGQTIAANSTLVFSDNFMLF
ncbi:MAG: exo-alpha-sialidase [Sarcina sp.]